MSDGTYRERWRDEVFRTSLVTDAVRVALLALLPEMDADGKVEAPRPHLAARLSRSERRVDDRLNMAIEAGFLRRLVRGGNGRGRTFQATLPDGSSETPGRPATRSRSRTPGSPATDGVAGRSTAPYPGVVRRSAAHYSASSETPGGPTTDPGSETPGGPATSGPIYKARARARPGDLPPQPGTTINHRSTDTDHRPGGTVETGGQVVPLFADVQRIEDEKTHAHACVSKEDPRFAEFWAAYPRRVGKGAARKAWAKAIKAGADPELVILGARRYATDPRRQAADIKYTAHPATWLNAERWADEDAPPPAAGNGTVLDRRQQATNDLFDRAMQRAIAREEGR